MFLQRPHNNLPIFQRRVHLHSRIRDEIVKRWTRQTQGWHEGGRKEGASRGQGFSGRGRARHGNKTRRTLISDSENREHEPCHTAHGSSSLSLSFSRSVVSRGPHGARNTACRIQLETRGDGMHRGRDERSRRRETIRNIRASLVSTGGMPYPWPLSPTAARYFASPPHEPILSSAGFLTSRDSSLIPTINHGSLPEYRWHGYRYRFFYSRTARRSLFSPRLRILLSSTNLLSGFQEISRWSPSFRFYARKHYQRTRWILLQVSLISKSVKIRSKIVSRFKLKISIVDISIEHESHWISHTYVRMCGDI